MIVTDSNFDEVIKDNQVVLVDFWAEWCGPCKQVSPILDEISEETGLVVAKMNIDENTRPKDFSVSSIPYMVLFENGVPVKTIIGAKPKHALMKDLDAWI